MAVPSRKSLATNLRTIARKRFGEKFQGKLIDAGVANGTLTRALKGDTSIGLDALDAIAKALDVSPASLLCGGYDPDDPPICIPASMAAHAKAGKIMEDALRKSRESSAK